MANSDEINHDSYISSLYSNSELYAREIHLQYLKKYGTVGLIEMKKRALNNIYTKLEVQEDLVTIKPLRKNGKYI